MPLPTLNSFSGNAMLTWAGKRIGFVPVFVLEQRYGWSIEASVRDDSPEHANLVEVAETHARHGELKVELDDGRLWATTGSYLLNEPVADTVAHRRNLIDSGECRVLWGWGMPRESQVL